MKNNTYTRRSRLLYLLTFIFLITTAIAQTPAKMNYQAVIRDTDNELVQNTFLTIQIRVLTDSIDGMPVYIEQHSTTTNHNGLFSLSIGEGTVICGNISLIDWIDNTFSIEIEMDSDDENSYSISGASQLLSIPYEVYARETLDITGINLSNVFDDQALSMSGICLNIETKTSEFLSYNKKESNFKRSVAIKRH